MSDAQHFRSTMKELEGTETHKVFAVYDAARNTCWLHFVTRSVPAASTMSISAEHMVRIVADAETFATEWQQSSDRAVLGDGTPIMLMLVEERHAKFLIRIDTGERLAAITAPDVHDRTREVRDLVDTAERWIANGAAISLHDRLSLDALHAAYTHFIEALEKGRKL